MAVTEDALAAWRQFLTDEAAARDYATFTRLARTADRLVVHPDIESRLTPVRLAVLGSATLDFLLPALKASLFALGLKPALHVAPYGQVSTGLLDPDGTLVRFAPQITLLSVATAHLPGRPALTASLPEVEAHVTAVCESLLGPCAVFHERTGSEIVLSNFAPPPWRSAGNLGARLPGELTSFIRRVNLALGDRAPRYVHIDDVAALAEFHGVGRWFDERYWYLAKQPVSFECVPAYSRHLAAIVGAVMGRTRKCLVVDLDNTLWGGVVGEDGVGGLKLGEGDPEGEAFLAFQRYLVELKERGVLLAVSSKNDDGVARTPFTDHPEMVLRLGDFVSFKANWWPKSESIRAIAREIDLPLDAFVFVDDNPAEREEVARALPEVAVPSMPEDAAGFVRAIDEARLFAATALTEEDRSRTAAYHARRHTREALAQTTDVDGYLASLDMRAVVRPFESGSFERITQLINKTNQFNLTTPRLVQAEVERMASDGSFVTRTVRLGDRFADHGLISVAYARRQGPALTIDAWLMSCRVLGRGVELLVFNEFLAVARADGLLEIVGEFRPTARNALVKDHYARLGFQLVDNRSGVERWRLAVEGAAPLKALIGVGGHRDDD